MLQIHHYVCYFYFTRNEAMGNMFVNFKKYIKLNGGGYPSLAHNRNTDIVRRQAIFSKRVVLVCLLFLLPSLSLFSASLEWKWSTDDEGVKYYRYKTSTSSEWTVVESTTTSLITDDTVNTLELQASYDGMVWSESSIGTYTYEKPEVKIPLSIRLNAAPYSSAVYYFYNGHYIDNARTLMGTVYGFSTSFELDWRPLSFLRLYIDTGYALEKKIQTVIPKEQPMHYLKVGGGLDFIYPVTEKTDIYLGALGGAMAHINNSKYSIAPYFGSRLGLDVALTEHITLGAFMRMSASFLNTSEVLYNSVTLLIDPMSLSLSYVF